MAEENEKSTESVPASVRETVEHLARIQRRLDYTSPWPPRVLPPGLQQRSRVYVVELEGVTGRHVLVTLDYSNPSPAEDYVDAAYDPQGQEGIKVESLTMNPTAPEQEAAGALINSTLAEVDAIIERMRQGREEFESLKEETRSNISEIQRMMAA